MKVFLSCVESLGSDKLLDISLFQCLILASPVI